MPPNVVDAFKSLIRHGKHHHHAHKDQDVDYLAATPRQDPSTTHVQSSSSASRMAAETIVNEEREAKNKMPAYNGLEGFKLIEEMGVGAFSQVYKAIDLSTGRKVAIKVVRKYELNSSQAGDKHLNPHFKKKPRVTERANILKETQIMRGTNHPSIVKLLSFSESAEHYFLVLELMEGGELFHQIVKLTYFSENLARHVILQVAHGIRYLHEERGVVHRDIKPENLLFASIPITPSAHPIQRPYDENKEDEGKFIPGVGGGGIGRVKIADFGLSKVVWNEETMTPCGTVGYTAPEIVKDERYSKSVDMWALGCVLYTLLCGFPPFYDESINVLTEKVARGYYTFLSPWWDDISLSAKDLIQHLLCVDPAQRYTIDEFLAHPWCNAAPAPPPPPTPFTYPSSSLPLQNRPLDSPLLRVQGRGSPGISTLKEMFDITYAVHRMEEEGDRRRARGAGVESGGNRRWLGGLNEDDEDDNAEMGQAHGTTVNRTLAGGDLDGRRGRSNQKDSGQRADPRSARGFDLDMGGATLLGRRHDKGRIGGSPLAGTTVADRLGSPMRVSG